MTVTKPLFKTAEESITIDDMPVSPVPRSLQPVPLTVSLTTATVMGNMSNYELMYVRALLASDLATVAPKYSKHHIAAELITRINLVLANRMNGS